VFQYPEYQLFEETVYKDIAFGPQNMGLSQEEVQRRVLEAAGFTVETVGDTAAGNCTERYCVYVLNDEKAGTRAALEERYGVTARPGAELPADIWAGTVDFVVIVGPEPVTEVSE